MNFYVKTRGGGDWSRSMVTFPDIIDNESLAFREEMCWMNFATNILIGADTYYQFLANNFQKGHIIGLKWDVYVERIEWYLIYSYNLHNNESLENFPNTRCVNLIIWNKLYSFMMVMRKQYRRQHRSKTVYQIL